MKQSIKERVHALRMTFHPNSIKAFIIPSTDPHLSEYVAPHWMSREWISGFTGSAGTAVILMDKAGLWTDSRYFLQATKELEAAALPYIRDVAGDSQYYRISLPTLKTWRICKYRRENVLCATGRTDERRTGSTSVTGRHIWRSIE